MPNSQQPDLAFTRALPKVELHAHLTGSISRKCLHNIWQQKKSSNPAFELEDPLIAIPSAANGTIDVVSFFPLFDQYIYALVCDEQSIRYATTSVLEDFSNDGVCYLEVRTTPRAIPAAGTSKEDYVRVVLEAIHDFSSSEQNKSSTLLHEVRLHTKLILSIDRKNTLAEAMEVVALAAKYGDQGVVGIDLCGNPTRKPISHLAPAFAEATAQGLAITLHFGEIAQTDDAELETMLDWKPQRLGHVIHVPSHLKPVIAETNIGLELCLSCNVLCKLSQGGFEAHHFGEWWKAGSAIALSTDDVGIFESGLSNEYLLAARHFGLDKKQLVELSRGAVDVIFGGEAEKKRMWALLDKFWGEECEDAHMHTEP
ncbi:Metallo-dependent hydrolase [Aureobasidium sp. EXF-12298]|nr:Metallo-dependent hydrolase [Aureobasidium sp. EXF-12298]